MTKEEIVQNSKRIIESTKSNPHGGIVQARDFLRIYAGENSSFLKLYQE